MPSQSEKRSEGSARNVLSERGRRKAVITGKAERETKQQECESVGNVMKDGTKKCVTVRWQLRQLYRSGCRRTDSV